MAKQWPTQVELQDRCLGQGVCMGGSGGDGGHATEVRRRSPLLQASTMWLGW